MRIDLGMLFRPAEPDEPLACTATVDDADLVTATLDRCVPTLTSSDDRDDGATTVTLTVTDSDGQTTTPSGGLLRGARRVVLPLAPHGDQPDPAPR